MFGRLVLSCRTIYTTCKIGQLQNPQNMCHHWNSSPEYIYLQINYKECANATSTSKIMTHEFHTMVHHMFLDIGTGQVQYTHHRFDIPEGKLLQMKPAHKLG